MRHGLISVPDFDKNPRIDDMRYLSAWGTGMGVDYNGEVGVVNNVAPCGGYFFPDNESGQEKKLIRRQFVGDKPEAGKIYSKNFKSGFSKIIVQRLAEPQLPDKKLPFYDFWL